ncbi:MAG: hypothetical protein LBK66_05850 [Spirochaetaceae bacterium]|jgi:hypothetical protein|nr:hypothetical protein [Spirochaetaceae bacterium]
MKINSISNVGSLINFVSENSTWSPVTVSNAVSALGYRKNGALESLKRLSSCLVDCAKHGAACGIHGFTMYHETVKFFQENRRDIVRNIELAAKIIGKDDALMIQGFGVYRGQRPPSVSDISRALRDMAKTHGDLTDLYNVFSWFCLEDISNIWYRYLDNNYPFYASLTLTA